ncbi:MAG: Tad domain-containing protein [Elusimicrobia bacterium]|nr:Tad domain-containing protein [Elusimicrobiota bacterium]
MEAGIAGNESRVGRRGSLPGFFASRRGQILIPSLFIIPSLMLFVYLLFETTKVSREKIRQQFAVDSAAFIQMSDYTNLLNRTAYVNGAFPYRIFKEAYECPGPDGANEPLHYAKDPEGHTICAYDMMYQAGAFPKYKGDVSGQDPPSLDDKKQWEIAFYEPARPDVNKNTPSITQASGIRSDSKPPTDADTFQLVTYRQGVQILVPYTSSGGYFKFYAQVYSLLGTVEKSQWTVFDRLTENFNFFRKSYYLNSNACEPSMAQACGNDGVFSPNGFAYNRLVKGSSFLMHYISKLVFVGRFHNPSSPYDFGQSLGMPDLGDPNINMLSKYPPDGLFQLASVTPGALRTLGDGLDVYQGWDAPANYFKVDFKGIAKCKETGRPCVHARIATQCPNLQGNWPNSGGQNNCVWPNPTPKYQTRLYP